MKTKHYSAVFLGGVALAMAVSCELFSGGAQKETVRYTEDGRPFVNLQVHTGGGAARSLTLNMAKTFNFFEVVFKDSTGVYYSFSTRLPNPMSISIPADDYSSGNVVLLAGAYNNNYPVLYAYSGSFEPLDSSGSSAGSTDHITATTKTLQFTLTALKTNINPQSGTASLAVNDGGVVPVSSVTDNTTNKTYPYWELPASNNAWYLTLTITDWPASGIADATSADNLAAFSFIGPNIDGYNDAGPDWFGAGIRTTTLDNLTTNGNFDPAAGIIKVGGASAAGNGPITGLETPADTGFAVFSFNIPVKALDTDTANKSRIWNLRNGLSNADIDTGDNTSATGPDAADAPVVGAGILLGVGNIGTYTVTPGP
ncbi:MAG: hypothetical protein LBC72_04805 [Spirochaetaceae bacterium]|jgi:hypothetical protein|nr:hypothetical protein [Spirochaetaceae bacterium]